MGLKRKSKLRRLKKHILGVPQDAALRVGLGSEPCVLKDVISEVEDIRKSAIHPPGEDPQVLLDDGSIKLKGFSFRSLLEITCRSRTARDVLWLIHEARSNDFGRLKHVLGKVDWELYLPKKATIVLNVNSTASRLFHEGAIFGHVKKALEDQGHEVVKTSELSTHENVQHLHVTLRKNMLRIFLSLAGSPLYLRGFKTVLKATASLKEDLAAYGTRFAFSCGKAWGIKLHDVPLQIIVPFAGSGTLGFESIMNLWNITPILLGRSYAFEALPAFPDTFLGHTKKKLVTIMNEQQKVSPLINLTFIENDPIQAEALRDNILSFRNRLREASDAQSFDEKFALFLEESDFFSWSIPTETITGTNIFIPLNPPYGKRLGSVDDALRLYANLGQKLGMVKLSKGSSLFGFIFCPSPKFSKIFVNSLKTGSKKSHFRSTSIKHGGQIMELVAFNIMNLDSK